MSAAAFVALMLAAIALDRWGRTLTGRTDR